MKVKLGINGFGRIGRGCIRAALRHPDVEVSAVNSTRDPQMLAHLLTYDSVYGKLDADVKAEDGYLTVGDQRIRILADRDPAKLPWADADAEIVLEATGVFRRRDEAALHLRGGAKRVIITAPGKNEDLTAVVGVNHTLYDPQKHYIVSNASCTTNCLAPVAMVIDREFGIRRAFMTTIHSYTNDQRILDLTHKDYRRARAAAVNIIPTTTGAAKAVSQVLPNLQGKIDGDAVRVPTPTVSLINLVAELEQDVDAAMINEALEEASSSNLKGIMACSDKPLVSSDYIGNAHSSIVDLLSTMVIEKRMVKLLAWYDNEWGYCCRVLDLAAYMSKIE